MACKCPRDPTEIRITLDGNLWCALRGEDPQTCEVGIGSLPEVALANLLLKEEGRFGHVSKTLKEILALADEAYDVCKGDDCSGCPVLDEGEDICALERIREIVMLQQDLSEGC
ncbi:MAG: hypothetical protein PHP55_11145 [Methanoculleus sp.]|jgi:hypothetical protein|nr:hypothetical protein [Methanoculleus sp.]